jgi:hypothetical protein
MFLVKPIPKASSGLWELEYICFTDALLVPLHHVAHGIDRFYKKLPNAPVHPNQLATTMMEPARHP